jgi:ubiquinol-cytochrome c reductase cytochrome c subunit
VTTSIIRRLLLPVVVLTTVGLSMLVFFAGGSSGASDSATLVASTVSEAQANSAKVSVPPAAYQTGRANAGTANSTVQVFHNGKLVSYGNSDILYTEPPAALIPMGQALYAQNCASCHGDSANGVPAVQTPGSYPNLRGLGSATIDFWIESGRMPAADTTAVQANRKQSKLTHEQALAVTAYVASLSPATPYIPTVRNLDTANTSDGFSLFALNCAACHTITGGGDALASGTYAPSLRKIPATQVAEAIRTGPGNMPRFTGNLSDAQVRNIVAYVTGNIQHPMNPGGFGLGGLGPVAEGFIGLALGVGLLALVAFWIGDRT